MDGVVVVGVIVVAVAVVVMVVVVVAVVAVAVAATPGVLLSSPDDGPLAADCAEVPDADEEEISFVAACSALAEDAAGAVVGTAAGGAELDAAVGVAADAATVARAEGVVVVAASSERTDMVGAGAGAGVGATSGDVVTEDPLAAASWRAATATADSWRAACAACTCDVPAAEAPRGKGRGR